MLTERIGFAWKLIPSWLRLRLIRTTQVKFTVSCAAMITNDKGQVLLLKHVLRPRAPWGMPGGFVDPGEQPEAAIRREIREETGIEVGDVEMLSVRTLARHVEILFRAHTNQSGKVSSREILELGWFEVESMPEDMSRSQMELIRKILRD